jgi:hypothetical protein
VPLHDNPIGHALPETDSHGVSLGRFCRLYPDITVDRLIAIAGDAFLLMHRHTRRLSSTPASTAVSDVTMRADTGDSIIVVYPLLRRPESDHAVVTIGRLDGNDVSIVEPTVSKYHAFVRLEGGAYIIQDANSRNGTFVDGVAVAKRGAGPAKILHPECMVRFGSVITTFVDAKAIVELTARR